MTQGAPVVVIGDALIDVIVTPQGRSEFVGGAALNVAVGLAILGVPACLIAMVGDDDDGRLIRDFLAEHGVALIAEHAPHGSARATSVRRDGEPSYSFNAAAQARRIEFDEAARAAIALAPLVVVSCFAFDDPSQTAELRDAVAAPEKRLIIDVNPREGLLRDAVVFRREFEATARTALIVKIGDEDAALLYQSDVEQVAGALLASGAGAVVTTLGPAGAEVHLPDRSVISRPIAALPGEIVDTMGAGDATLASISAAVLRRSSPMSLAWWGDALDDAMLLAAATCRVAGATLRRAN